MSTTSWIRDLPGRGLAVRLAVLSGVMLLLFLGVLPVALGGQGAVGFVAIAIAGGVCWASAAGAMLVSRCLQSLGATVAGILLPMALRTGVPLLLALVIRLRGPGLVSAGLVYYLLAFYLVALAVEVPLSLPRAGRLHGRSGEPSPNSWRPHG